MAIVKTAESAATTIWRKRYHSNVVGLDCLDLAPPDRARIFIENGWSYLGKTTGNSRDGRAPSFRVASAHVGKVVPSLVKIHPEWSVYAKKTSGG